jgi:hypothetical protein
MEAENTSEVSISFYQTTCCNKPEDSHIQFSTSSVLVERFYWLITYRCNHYSPIIEENAVDFN